LLLWHDGTPARVPDDTFCLGPAQGFLNLDATVDTWQRTKHNVERFHGGPVDDATYSPRWLPIGTDWCGGHLVVDHRDTDTHGHVFTYDPESPPPPQYIWPSLSNLLDAELRAMQTGEPFERYGLTAHVTDDGALTWQ